MTHNLKGNFMSASGYGDGKMQCDILMSELAKIIVYRPSAVKTAFKNSGIDIKDKNYSGHELCAKVSDAIYKSPKFANEISKQILITHLPQVDKELRANGGNESVGGAPVIAQGLGENFGAIKNDPKKKTEAEKELKEKTSALGEIDNTGSRLKTALKWGVGIAVVSGIVWGVVHYWPKGN